VHAELRFGIIRAETLKPPSNEEIAFDTGKVTSVEWISRATLMHSDATQPSPTRSSTRPECGSVACPFRDRRVLPALSATGVSATSISHSVRRACDTSSGG